MLLRKGIAAVTFIVSAMLASEGSNAAATRNFRIGDWHAGAYSDNRTGAFSHCGASATYRSGVTVLFAVHKGWTWEMSFVHPDWRLPPGNTYEIAFTVDDMTPLMATATAISREQVRVPLADSAELFRRFQKGRQLRVGTAGQTFTFNLKQTNQVLQELLECTRLEGKPPAVASNPFETAKKTDRKSGSDASGPTYDPLLHAEAATVAANVLSKSGIQGFSLMSTEKAVALRSHAAWSAGDNMLGTVSILTGNTEQLLKEMPKNVIARAAGACKANFLSGAMPEDGKTQISRAFTTCQLDGEKAATTYHLAMPRKRGGIYVFGTMSMGSEAPAKSAADSIRNVMLDLKD
jgi:hypothetical protein